MNAASDPALVARRRNPALDAMAAAWMGLRSPMHRDPLDHRFEQWFSDAEQHLELLADFAPRMLDSVTDWLAEYERKSSVVTPGDERCLAQFDAWMDLVMRYPTVAAVLADPLAKGKQVRTQRLVAVHTRDFHAAIDAGELADAARELRAIEELPDAAAADLIALHDAIETLSKRKTEIEEWQNEVTASLRDWQDVARLQELRTKGCRLAETRGTPHNLAERVRREVDRLQSLARDFIGRRADACSSLDAIRTELAAIPRTIDQSCLEPLFAALLRVLDRSVEGADSATALRRMAASCADVAPPLDVREALHRINDVAAAWELLESNGLPDRSFDGVLPARFAERLDVAQRLAERVAAAEPSMDANGASYGNAIAALEEILIEAPGHPAAKAKLDRLRLDDAIERWDLDQLRYAEESFEGPYAALLQAIPVLEDLAQLRRPAFTDLRSVGEWWRSWRGVEAHLPAQKPEALRRALGLVRREAAEAVHRIVKDYCARTTTVHEDRVAEAAVAELVIDIGLRNDLLTLTERRNIHAAVLAAREHGASALASLLRESWGTIERYLPWADSIRAEAFERAWEESNDDALEALGDVPVDDARHKQMLEWLGLEKELSAALTADGAQQLNEYLRRQGAPDLPLVRRLGRVIEKWRGRGDDAALTWAYRAFAQLDPPLLPGVDPLSGLTRTSLSELASIVRACREAVVIDEVFVAEKRRQLDQTQEAWTRLEQLLLIIPPSPGDPWPAPPPELAEARQLLEAIQTVLDSIARWRQSDVRRLGEQCDGVRRILRTLSALPAALSLERVLRTVEPLTRMNGLETYLREACRRCGSTDDVAARDLFALAARCLDAVIDTLRAAQPEGAHTLQVVTAEYWREIPSLAGDLLPANPGGGLDALRERLSALHQNELLFRDAVDALWREQPNIGASGEFDPAAHAGYLALYPRVAPSSLRVRRLFGDFAMRAAQAVIIRRSRELLPEWLQRYVDNLSRGVSPW